MSEFTGLSKFKSGILGEINDFEVEPGNLFYSLCLFLVFAIIINVNCLF